MLARIDPLDAGPRNTAAATERLCVATRSIKPTTDMIRFEDDNLPVWDEDTRTYLDELFQAWEGWADPLRPSAMMRPGDA